MAMLEKTQFSMIDLNAFEAEKREPRTERERFMVAFRSDLAEQKRNQLHEQVEAVGGIGNVQRVRILSDDRYVSKVEVVAKVPVSVMEARKKAAAEAERRQKLAELRAKRAPQVKKAQEAHQKREEAKRREQFLRSPAGVKAAFEEALKQDQRQRAAQRQRKPATPQSEQAKAA